MRTTAVFSGIEEILVVLALAVSRSWSIPAPAASFVAPLQPNNV